MKRLSHTALLITALGWLAAACQTQDRMVRTELFFGLSRPDGGMVSQREFSAFVDEVITPRFPQGLTILAGDGQWREKSGNIAHEPSRIVILVHADDRESDRSIEEIRESYKSRFRQEAVMRIDEVERVRF